MNDIRFVEGGVCAPQGYRAAGVYSGISGNQDKPDLALIVCDRRAAAAAVYTKNKVKAAHIGVMKAHLSDGMAQAVVCNSGNANTCTPDGTEVAEHACQVFADACGIRADDVMPASTGIIGVSMPKAPFDESAGKLASALSYTGSSQAAHAIMTTDTHPKERAVEFTLGGKTCRIGGIAKGSGMIHVNMGTTLNFLTSDAAISPAMLAKALREEVPDSYNQISVDGDTSTNDTLFIMADGMAGNPEITGEGEDYRTFCEALHVLCVDFARQLAGDGEGATKLLEAHVTGAPTKDAARKISKSVICSSLLKAAMYGEDANWGRVICAVGYTDADFSVSNVDISIRSGAGEIAVCRGTASVPFSEEEAAAILSEEDVILEIDLHDGTEEAWAWGCDLTHEYVKINGEYRS